MAEKGLKSVDLAERLGVSEANISRWLRGNQNLSLDTMYKLADAVKEPLRVSIGHDEAAVSEVASESYVQENSDAAVVIQEFEAAADCLVEDVVGQRSNVIDIAAYAQLRARTQTNRGDTFAVARSEFEISDLDDRMVN